MTTNVEFIAQVRGAADTIAQWRAVGSLPPADLKVAYAIEKRLRDALASIGEGGGA